MAYFVVQPCWIRFSDFDQVLPMVVEAGFPAWIGRPIGVSTQAIYHVAGNHGENVTRVTVLTLQTNQSGQGVI